MNLKQLKEDFVKKYISLGSEKFYKFLILYALNKIILIEKEEFNGAFPNIEFLNIYDKFIILYRREGDKIYLNIAKIFRKAAHKIYRVMLKKNITSQNDRFLNLV